jgi:hypothetical protein
MHDTQQELEAIRERIDAAWTAIFDACDERDFLLTERMADWTRDGSSQRYAVPYAWSEAAGLPREVAHRVAAGSLHSLEWEVYPISFQSWRTARQELVEPATHRALPAPADGDPSFPF